MTTELPQRLAAILAADIAGYTRLMELDEAGVVAGWRRARAEIIDPTVARFQGRIVKLTGDGFLAEFSTVESAVRAALAMQEAFSSLFAAMPVEARIAFRMGVNVGDIWVDTEDIYGAGVNVAARLESLAEPGGLCISGSAHDAVKHKIAVHYESMGRQTVKNVAAPIEVWRVRLAPPAQSGVRNPPRPARSRGWRPMLGWTVAAVVAAVAILVAGNYVRDGAATVGGERPAEIPQKSVAVLPFADLSAAGDQAWLADGLTEEILNSLAQLQELRVPARTSSFEFKNQDRNIGEIAQVLRVANVVEGSVRRVGDDLRVTAQLIRGADGYHLWSATYARKADDLFDVQRDIAERIAEALDVLLDDGRRDTMFRSGTRNVEAFEAYRKGMDVYWAVHDFSSDQTLWAANDYFDQALKLDPGYAAAALGRTDAFVHQVAYDGSRFVANSPYTQEEALVQLRRSLELAVDKAPTRGMRLAADLAREFFGSTWYRMPELIAQLRLEWDSNSVSLEGMPQLIEILLLTGNYVLLRDIAKQQLAVDPLSPASWSALATAEFVAGNPSSAREAVSEARRAIGNNPGLQLVENRLRFSEETREETIRRLSALLPNPDTDAFLAALRGDTDTALRLADDIESRAERPSTRLIPLYFIAGATDRMRALVKRIDDLPSGFVLLTDEVAYRRIPGEMMFDVEDTPNFLAKLRQAGVDPGPPSSSRLNPLEPTTGR